MPDLTGRPRVLILGGTTEARRLAAALVSPAPRAAASAASSEASESAASEAAALPTSEAAAFSAAPASAAPEAADSRGAVSEALASSATAASPAPEAAASVAPAAAASRGAAASPAWPPRGTERRDDLARAGLDSTASALPTAGPEQHHDPAASAPPPAGAEQRDHLAAAAAGGYSVISSLAGRTSRPLEIAGDVRVGGFGGVEGLVDFLRTERIDAVVDATHPFAGTMTRHAVVAAAKTRTPLLVLRRPGWVRVAGDDWTRVRDLAEAAALLPRLGDRVFLTTGRQGIGAFAAVEGAWFLSRSVEKPTPPMPADLDIVLDRGPFTLDGERRLMAERNINVLVTKDSGGPAPKLAAARELGIPVIVVERPAVPEAPIVATVEAAVEWLARALPKVAER